MASLFVGYNINEPKFMMSKKANISEE